MPSTSKFSLAVLLSAFVLAGNPSGRACAGSPLAQTSGRTHFARTGSMAVERVFHTASLLPNGKVLIAGGKSTVGILDVAEIYDSSAGKFVQAAGPMIHARKDHTATLLGNGTVLITGGDNGQNALNSAEIFEPRKRVFRAVRPMFSARTFHTATLIPKAKGRVLILGGAPALSPTQTPSGLFAVPQGALDTAEAFDPSTGQFLGVPEVMNSPRTQHSATLLRDGTNVLIAGGIDDSGFVLNSAEVYNSRTGLFSTTRGAMTSQRRGHAAVRLHDGRVLITGGLDNNGALLSTAELYDPKTRTFTATISGMSHARAFHTATLLADGRVLISGGSSALDSSGNAILDESAEIYDPVAGTFSVPIAMASARVFQTATPIRGGTLLAGGIVCCGQAPFALCPPINTNGACPAAAPSAEIFGAGATFAATSSQMIRSRGFHTATRLNNGDVLIAGGAQTQGRTFNDAELYDPSSGRFSPAPGLIQARGAHTATVLKNGVLIAGGLGPGDEELASAELYDPLKGPAATGSLVMPRDTATATLLNDGTVLIAGGEAFNSTALQSAELYDPATGTFSCVGGSGGGVCNPAMTSPRVQHAATLLNDGRVLITGGIVDLVNVTFASSAELYDPATATFTATGSMVESRAFHSATLLGDGEVLVAGGSGDQSAELYDPVTGTFSCVGGLLTMNPPLCQSAMASIRFGQTATLLGSGAATQVLITGGYILNAFGEIEPQASTEIFELGDQGRSPGFRAIANMTADRVFHTATPINKGRVLITGGLGTNGALSTAEIFVPR